MLAIMLVAALQAPQSDPPSTSALMDMPITAIGTSGELMYSEAETPAAELHEIDDRFRMSSIVTLPAGLSINSYSRGTGAFYSVRANGEVSPDINMMGWSFKIFAIAGGPWTGTPYAGESSVDGDVYAILDQVDMEVFPDEQIGSVHKLRDGAEVGVGPIRGLDSYLSGLAGSDDYVDEMEEDMGASRPEFYFSVAGALSSYGLIPLSWVGNDPTLQAPSTIFKVVFDGTKWGTPSVAWSAADLGITANTEVTALSVMDEQFEGADDANGIEVLYCTNSDDLEKKMMVRGTWRASNLSTPSVPGPLSTTVGPLYDGAGGLFIQTKLGFTGGQQRIVGTCDEDPGDDPSSHPHARLRRECTALLSDGWNVNREIVYSFHRLRQNGNTANSMFRATVQGHVGAKDAWAILSDVWPAVKPLAVVPRSNQAGVDKQSSIVKLPLTGTLSDVAMRWYIVDTHGNLLGQSYEFTVSVR